MLPIAKRTPLRRPFSLRQLVTGLTGLGARALLTASAEPIVSASSGLKCPSMVSTIWAVVYTIGLGVVRGRIKTGALVSTPPSKLGTWLGTAKKHLLKSP